MFVLSLSLLNSIQYNSCCYCKYCSPTCTHVLASRSSKLLFDLDIH